MKVLGNLTVDKDSNVKYPFGANIKNETDTENGTPVVREIYGDVLMNLYDIMEKTGVSPNGIEDDKTTQFQLVEALKKLPNSLNDIEQVLTLSSGVWSVPFDLAYLPNKYAFIARASDNYVAGTFKGIGATSLPFFSNGFRATDELLIIIDTAGVRAYSLSKFDSSPDSLALLFSGVLRYNSGGNLYYQKKGILYTNIQAWDIQNTIRSVSSNPLLSIKECSFMGTNLVCALLDSSTLNYSFYYFKISDFSTAIPITLSGVTQTNGIDLEPSFYFSDNYIYASNECNTNILDKKLTKLVFDPILNTISVSSYIEFDVVYSKTDNACIRGNNLFMFANSGLDVAFIKIDLTTGVGLGLGLFPIPDGVLFTLNGDLYVETKSIGHKLNI